MATNVDRMTSTAREMAEVQRESFEALAENFAASQRRGTELAQEGSRFFKLQEENARVAQEWFKSSSRLLELQQRNVNFVQNWMSSGARALRAQTEQNLKTADVFVRSARKQQEGLQTLGQEWVGAYRKLLAPVVRAEQQGFEAVQQTARQGLRLAEETTRQTGEALEQAAEATREAELETAVHSALKTKNYDELNVEDVTKKLDGLSVDELKKVREYEKQSKARETLIEQIDRRIKAAS
ncbi:hypothetical protein [Rubrobacter indicoceani]|uniref:hypothetical protein n=1 Tax=Rubrobacter indicoceani TaxID=2051957 RepID=UPI0013C50E5D|nr:hypothetical protein [Rubrobacter indicoceani]